MFPLGECLQCPVTGVYKYLKLLPRKWGYLSQSATWTMDEVRDAYKAFLALCRNGKTKHNAPRFRPRGTLSGLHCHQEGFKVDGDAKNDGR